MGHVPHATGKVYSELSPKSKPVAIQHRQPPHQRSRPGATAAPNFAAVRAPGANLERNRQQLGGYFMWDHSGLHRSLQAPDGAPGRNRDWLKLVCNYNKLVYDTYL